MRKLIWELFTSEKKLHRVLKHLLIGCLIPLVISLPLAPIMGSPFWKSYFLIFLWFGAPCIVSAGLILVTSLDPGLDGFGIGLYYGSIFVSAIVKWLFPGTPFDVQLIIGITIASLSCYIVYLKHFKK